MRVVVASLPRCGSTYLVRSILGEKQGGRCPALPDWLVKTHRMPDNVLRPGDRAVFLHGDMAEAVVSTIHYRHDPVHFANLGREHRDVDLLEQDYLGYVDLVDAWLARSDVMALTYEALRVETVRGALEAHIGRRVQWLPWRRRRTIVTAEEREKVRAAYGYDGVR